jgi:protein-S-isoprenylcysteine O-methyltransferase Ste14
MPAPETHVLETDGGRTDPRAAPARGLATATAVLFLISSAFPVAAGLARDTAAFPRWWGVLDVALAFVLALAAMAVATVGQRHVDADIEAQPTARIGCWPTVS